MAVPLGHIPGNTVAGNWPREARRILPVARWLVDGGFRICDLVDLEFQGFNVFSDNKTMRFNIADDGAQAEYEFRVASTPMIIPARGADTIQVQIAGDEWTPLAVWLSEYPPYIFLQYPGSIRRLRPIRETGVVRRFYYEGEFDYRSLERMRYGMRI